MEKRLNTAEASGFLKEHGTPFTPGTLEVWRCLGRGPRFRRVNRRVFYLQSDLEAFAKGQVVETVDSLSAQGGRIA